MVSAAIEGYKRLGAAKVEGLFVPLRLSVALSSPSKMSTKALAAIAKVKSEHILKVILQRKSVLGFIFESFSFVYFLNILCFGSKRKEIGHSRRLCCLKVEGNTNERPFGLVSKAPFRNPYQICG